MFGRDSGDSKVLCPYDDTHIILAKSFNSHLVKCRKNNPQHKKVPCKFDRTHQVPKPELQHHHSVCPSRVLLDRELQLRSGNTSSLKGDVSGPPIKAVCTEEASEENWDEAPKYVAKNALFYKHVYYDDLEAENSQHTFGNDKGVEDFVQRKPRAPSKVEQLSAQVAPRPVPSSNQVYQYALGRGRGRGLAQAPPGPVNVVQPLGRAGHPIAPTASVNPPQVGRGITRYATTAPNMMLTAAPPHGIRPSVTPPPGIPPPVTPLTVQSAVPPPMMPSTLSPPRGGNQPSPTSFSTVTSRLRDDDCASPSVSDSGSSQFEDTEETLEEPPTPVVNMSQSMFGNSLDEEMKELLVAERLRSQRELEELKQRQEERHLRLMQMFQQKLLLQQQQQQQQEQQQQQVQQQQPNRAPQKQDHSEMSEEQRRKEIRKLEKKLKQVSALEDKVAQGIVLTSDEETKVEKKSSLLKELERLK